MKKNKRGEKIIFNTCQKRVFGTVAASGETLMCRQGLIATYGGSYQTGAHVQRLTWALPSKKRAIKKAIKKAWAEIN